MTQKKTYHHGDLRAHLVETIRELIEESGPDGFRIAEACRRAGVSTAAPYKHFADRDAILRAVALSGMERLRDAMAVAAASHPGGDPARIAALGRSYVAFARAEPGVFRMMFGLTEAHGGDPALEAVGAQSEAIVSRVVAQHLGWDPASPRARLRAYALWCFVHGHCFLMLDGKRAEHAGEVDEAEMLAEVGRLMLAGG